MTVPAGNRSSYLTIYRESSTTADAAGQLVPTFTKLCNAWGEIRSAIPPANAAGIRGQTERWAGYHMNVDAQFVITIPYPDVDIVATDKITETWRDSTVTYQIAGQPLDNGGELLIPVSEVT